MERARARATILRMVRTEVGVLLVAAMLVVPGCGSSTNAVTHTGPGPAAPAAPAAPVPPPSPGAPVPSPETFSETAVGDAVGDAASGAGDAVLATAALAAAAATRPGTAVRNAGPRLPPPAPIRTMSSSATGEYAVAQANGTFRRPAQIVLKVAATPSQLGSVYWSIVCAEVGGGVGRNSAQAKVELPMSENLTLPAPSSSCIASANVQLRKSGSVGISLTG